MRSDWFTTAATVCTLQASHIEISADTATTSLQRLVGLLAGPPRNLWLPGVRAVHTFGMRYSIDLWFFDHRLRLRRVVRTLKPWRIAWHRQARHVLELPGGKQAPPPLGTLFSLRTTEVTHGR